MAIRHGHGYCSSCLGNESGTYASGVVKVGYARLGTVGHVVTTGLLVSAHTVAIRLEVRFIFAAKVWLDRIDVGAS